MDKEGWQEQAYAALRNWAKTDWLSFGQFGEVDAWTVEKIRTEWFRCLRLDPPGDLRWFGPVVQRALREKIIRRKGFAPAKSSHGALKARYVGTRHA